MQIDIDEIVSILPNFTSDQLNKLRSEINKHRKPIKADVISIDQFKAKLQYASDKIQNTIQITSILFDVNNRPNDFSSLFYTHLAIGLTYATIVMTDDLLGEENIGIKTLVKDFKKLRPDINPLSTEKDYQEFFLHNASIIQKISSFRNQYVAHTDEKLFDLQKTFYIEITENDFSIVFNFLQKYTEKMYCEVFSVSPSQLKLSETELSRIFKAIKIYQEHTRELTEYDIALSELPLDIKNIFEVKLNEIRNREKLALFSQV
jgi:hypothetical protein